MTDRPKNGEDELVLDWEDAVESFRLDLEGSARAEAAPFPQRAQPERKEVPNGEAPIRENERPTLPPRGLMPEKASERDPSHVGDPFALGTLESLLPPHSERPLTPPRRPSFTSRTLPSVPGRANPAFGHTLSGLAPMSPPPAIAPSGGTSSQQRATLRPGGAPAEAKVAEPARPLKMPIERPSAEYVEEDDEDAPHDEDTQEDADAAPGEHSPGRRMYQPPTPLEVARLSARTPEFDDLDLSDDSEATQIAAIPRELLEALLAGGSVERGERITERPPLAGQPATLEQAPELGDPEELDAAELAELDLVLTPHEEGSGDDDGAQRATLPHPRTSHAPRGLPPAPPQIAMRLSRPASSLPPSVTEASVLRDLDDLLPPVAKQSSRPAPKAAAPRPDRGARAAQHTVSATQRRVGYGPLSALDDSGKRARLALLEALAQKQTGLPQAQLLVTAAEICEELGDSDGALGLYTRAHESMPRLLGPLRALARLAFLARDFDAHVEWLSREAEACSSPASRAAALMSIARVRWLAQRDLPSALRAATEAVRLCPSDPVYRLLAARIELATRPAGADTHLAELAVNTSDPHLAPAWLSFAARTRDSRGERSAAKQLYQSARERSPSAFDVQLGLLRIAHAEGDREGAALALATTLPSLGTGVLDEVVRRRAAMLLGYAPELRADALALLETATDALSLRTAFSLARSTGDVAAEERATLVWTTHSEGPDRALSLVAHARQLIHAGRLKGAADALEEALSIDRSLTLAKVLWDGLAQESGDAEGYLRRAGQAGGGLLWAAAKVAFDLSAVTAEAELLARTDHEREAACQRVLQLDAHAEALDFRAVRAHFEPLLALAAPEPSALLCWADFARRHDDPNTARETLARAADLYPDELLVTRAFARAATNNEDLVRGMLMESSSARGMRAAFACVLAGHLQSDPLARIAAFERAYEAQPGYAPAVLALHAEARKQNDLSRLANLHARESTRAKDPFEVVAHLLRAALVRAHDDGDAAAAQLGRAHDLALVDPVLRELVIRLGDAIPASLRAEAMQRTAEGAEPPFDRPATLAAAGAFEDAGQAERALALYEGVLHTHPEDPIAEMGRERVAKAAGKARELLEAKRRAIHEASTDTGRIRALEELLQADTDAPAEESLDRARALLVLSPSHQLALRRTERHAMERNDIAALQAAELRLLSSSSGPKDRLSRLRFLLLLAALREQERAQADDLDQVLVDAATNTFGGPWLARQLMGAGIALKRPEVVLTAIDLFCTETSEPVELASLAVRRARLELTDPPHDREDVLCKQLESYPDHPTGGEALAELAELRADYAQAATRFAEAAQKARHPARAARLWSRAGKLYEEQLGDREGARSAYKRAVEADVTFGDAEARLGALLSDQSDLDGLIALTSARLAAGVTADVAIKLRAQLAGLYDKRGEPALAIQTLRDASAQTPDDLPTLRELARLLRHEKEHREHAQTLLRIARLSREPIELRDVFMQLGDIYDHALPDPKRAEAAYQRALKLSPRHVPALTRLAALYAREGQHEHAEATFERLAALAENDSEKIEAYFALARSKENRGDTRGAEETLEGLRREESVRPEVLRTLAEFYRRQGALSALAMHLNRAANDLREVLAHNPSDAQAWLSLINTLDEKQRTDATRVTASAALACGVSRERVAKYLEEKDAPKGVVGAAFSELLDDLVFSDSVPPSTRIMFRHGAEALNKAVSFDLRAVGGERLDRRHPLRAAVQEVARWAGMPEVDVFTSTQLPLAFVPVSDSPAQLLVGSTLLDSLTHEEQLFLAARALKIARANMSITCRIRPDEMGLLIHGLMHSQMPGYAPEGVPLAAVEEMGRRVAKHLNRRTLPELVPHLMELMGAADFDPSQVYTVASTAGNRAGLLAVGSVAVALSALTKLAGLPAEQYFDNRLFQAVEEARDLLSFAVSDAHFEARLRAGVDLR